MYQPPSRQRGMTFLGFVMLMCLIGFFSMLIIKIGPIYLDHYKVVASLEGLKADPDLPSRSKQDILSSLAKRWDIDMVSSVTKDDVYVAKEMGKVTVQVAYDVTKPIMGNIDVLVHFNDSIEVGAN
jgi:hypothetical protein